MSRRAVLAGSVAASVGAPAIARAQGDWPKGPIRVVVPFPPGGTTDPVARILAAKVADNTGWNMVIDNKPGAAGAIGAAIAAKAPPDGMTWMITFDSHILSPAFTPNMTYKDSDLMNVMLVGRAPLAAACPPDRPYKTFADVMTDAKQRPGKPSIGLLSASGAMLLAGEFLASVGVMIFDVNQNSLMLMLIPHQVRSRVVGVSRFFNYGTRPFGALLGGVLGSAIGLRPTLWVAVAGCLVGVFFLLASPMPHLREEDLA